MPFKIWCYPTWITCTNFNGFDSAYIFCKAKYIARLSSASSIALGNLTKLSSMSGHVLCMFICLRESTLTNRIQ